MIHQGMTALFICALLRIRCGLVCVICVTQITQRYLLFHAVKGTFEPQNFSRHKIYNVVTKSPNITIWLQKLFSISKYFSIKMRNYTTTTNVLLM